MIAAFETSRLAITLIDSMRNELNEPGSKQDMMNRVSADYAGAIDLAYLLHERTADPAYLSVAFEISEKGKAVLLLHRFRFDEARHFGGVSGSLLDREARLQGDLRYYEEKIFAEARRAAPDSLRIAHWQALVHDYKRQRWSLLDSLSAAHPAYHRLMYETRVATVDSVRAMLPKDGAWIQYVAADSFLYAFGISRTELRMARMPYAPGRLLAFVESLERPGQAYDASQFGEWSREAYALYEQLLAPVLPADAGPLTIVPDGVIAFLPFETLLKEAVPAAPPGYRSLPYLLRDHAISYDYAATLHARTGRASAPGVKKSLLGFAPAFSTGWVMAGDAGSPESEDFFDLRYNRAEIEYIHSLTGGKLFREAEASEWNFRQHAAHFQVLHLATHAYTNDDNPWLSGLAFAPDSDPDTDGFLHVYEICRMHIPAQLAVLSACNTGRGALSPGDGVMSLAWAFKYAGCPSIVMSQWQGDDAATQEIMGGFYRHLKAGETTVEALRQAKLEYLGSSARNHPFYWSSFVYLGKDVIIEWARPWYRSPLYGGLAVLLALVLGGGILFWRRSAA